MTHRHDDALAALDPADRALLALSIDRGLDDARIAQLTGVAVEAVGARRERVLAIVAAQLAIPADEVSAALGGDHRPTRISEPPPPSPATAGRTGRRTRRLSVIVASLLGLVVIGVVILVIAVAGDGSSRSGPPDRRSARVRPPPPARVAPAAPVSVSVSEPLRPLPGGPRRASGTLTLNQRGTTLTLDVRVRHLRVLRHGRYVAYLYDSILDSRALGAVRARGLTRLALPADAADYHEIDVSAQPRGVVNPSGESRLRGPNPARAYARGRRRGSRSRAPSTR